MSTLGDLMVRVGANLDDFNTAMAGVGSRLDAAASDAEKAWAPFQSLGTNLIGIGAGLSAAVTAPLLAIGAASTTMAGDFQHAMNRVSALGEITGKDLDGLRAQAIKLGADTQFSAQQAADAMGVLAASGFSAQQVFAAMPGVLSLAASGELSIEQAATVASDAMSQFNLTAADTPKIADTIAQAAASGKDSVQGLGIALGYAGPAAHSAGISLQDTAAALTLLAENGLRGERAGTALRTILIDLSKVKTKETLLEMGVAINDAAGKMLPLANILDQLKQKHLDLTTAAQLVGTEGASALLGMVEKGAPALIKLQNEIGNSTGAADRMAKTLNGGINGAIEQMKGSIETAGIALGQVLSPAVIAVTGLIQTAANKVSEFAQFFATLPAPIQAGVGAFVALAAAIGPITLAIGGVLVAIGPISAAIGGVTAVLGVSTAAFLGWVAVIPLAVAALVALGTWIAGNWDGITAVVLQAWSGVSEAWAAAWAPIRGVLTNAWNAIAGVASSVWDPIAAFFRKIWDGVEGYFASAWNAIKSALVGVWDGIKKAAESVWGSITKAFTDFLSWAEKIPGVNKLMNLDEAWNSAKKLSANVDAAAKSTENLKKKADDAAGSGKPIPKLGDSIAKVGSNAADAATKLQPLINKHTVLTATADALRKKHDEAVTAAGKLQAQLILMGDAIPTVESATETLNLSIQEMSSKMDAAKASIPGFTPLFNGMRAQMDTLGGGFKTLGITSATEYQSVADNAKIAYEAIAGSGIATGWEKNNAMLRMMEAQKAAMIANGQQIPEEFAAMLEKLNASVGDPKKGLPKAKEDFDTFGSDISRNLKSAFDGLTRTLFDDPASLPKKGIQAMKDLGQTVLDDMLKPIKDSAADLISGAITDLLGGKGFGGLIDKVKSFGETVSNVFSAVSGSGKSAAGGIAGALGSGNGDFGGEVSGGISSVGGAASSAGSAGSAAASGLSSIAGIAGAAGSIVGAISGIVGNFQNAKMETTMNAIEESTRYIKSYLRDNIIPMAQEFWPQIGYSSDRLLEVQKNTEAALGGIDLLAEMATILRITIADRLSDIWNDVHYGSGADQDNRGILQGILDAISGGGMRANITINVSGASNPAATGQAVASALATQGVRF